jgi:uncharacterized protein YlaN (UPF0358 family)
VNKLKTLEELENGIQKSKDYRTKALTQKEMHEKSLKEITIELGSLGTTPEKASNYIERLKKEINETKREIQEAIPFDLIEKREQANK